MSPGPVLIPFHVSQNIPGVAEPIQFTVYFGENGNLEFDTDQFAGYYSFNDATSELVMAISDVGESGPNPSSATLYNGSRQEGDNWAGGAVGTNVTNDDTFLPITWTAVWAMN